MEIVELEQRCQESMLTQAVIGRYWEALTHPQK